MPTGLDVAWYYSSLSQVSASIVGLIGGILISRLIDHMSVIRQRKEPLESEIYRLRSNFDNFYREISDLHKYFDDELKEYNHYISLSVSRVITTWMDFGTSGSGSGSMLTVDVMKSRREEVLKKLEAIKILEENKDNYLLMGPIKSLSLRLHKLNKVSEELNLIDEKAHAITYGYYESLENLNNKIIDFKSKIIPGHVVVVISLLIIISIFGIILPLMSLPGFDQKIYMLIFFSLALLSLMVYLLYHLYEFHLLGKLHWNPK